MIISDYKRILEAPNNEGVTRFNMFTDEELNAMESAFSNEKLIDLVDEIRRERIYRESSEMDKDKLMEKIKKIAVR